MTLRSVRNLLYIISLSIVISPGVWAANAAPTYRNVIDQLDKISPNASPEIKDAATKLKTDLANQIQATDLNERLDRLKKLQEDSVKWASWTAADPAADQVSKAVNRWVDPRLKAIEYAISARDSIKAGTNGTTDEHKKAYDEIVVPLIDVLHQYEVADKTGLRFDAREKIRSLVSRLEERLKQLSWPDAQEIINTIESRWESPNLMFTVSAEGLRPLLDRGFVNPESILYKGRVSNVTPGEKKGYGLIPSDDSIAFYIRQAMTSITPVTDFQQQVQSNQGGRILTRGYNLGNTIQNDSIVTMSVAVRPTGVALSPSYVNSVQPQLSIGPKQGGGMTRAVMGLAGMNQQRIVGTIYQRSIGQIQSETEVNSLELGQLRANESAAMINEKLSGFLRSNDSLIFERIVAERIKVRTEPTHIHAETRVLYQVPGIRSIGPLDVPPPLDPVDDRYITAALHIPNVVENLASNFFEELSKRGPATIAFLPDQDMDGALEVEVQSGQELLHLAVGESLRITKEPKGAKLAPGQPFAAIKISEEKLVPHFTMDDKGHIVMMLKAFKMDIAAPALTLFSEGRMGGAIRIDSPGAELDMEILNLPATKDQPERLAVKVHSFQLDPRSKIFTYSEASKEPTELSTFRKATVLAAASAFLASKPFDLPLDALRFGDKVKVVKVAPLGKLGWYQFVINADQLLDELGTPPAATPSESPVTIGAPPTPTNSASQAKTDTAVSASNFVHSPQQYVAKVPAGARYWVLPGTCPPEVRYEPTTNADQLQWVDVMVQPTP